MLLLLVGIKAVIIIVSVGMHAWSVLMHVVDLNSVPGLVLLVSYAQTYISYTSTVSPMYRQRL